MRHTVGEGVLRKDYAPRGGKKRRLYQGWGVIGVTTPKV